MRILLTNDDGIYAPGILAAKTELSAVGEVFVVAPERPRSAAAHAITLHKPLRIKTVELPDGSAGYAVSGTPTDCVTLGYEIVMDNNCQIVVSGINSGSNLGWDISYSGTVAGAIEGAVLGIPSFSISLVYSEERRLHQSDYHSAAEYAVKLVQQLQKRPLPIHTFLNVNVPLLHDRKSYPVEFTHQGRREYVDRIVTRIDPSGTPYYWQGGTVSEGLPDPGSDVHAVLNGCISVTPIQLDMTSYPLLDQLRKWNSEI